VAWWIGGRSRGLGLSISFFFPWGSTDGPEDQQEIWHTCRDTPGIVLNQAAGLSSAWEGPAGFQGVGTFQIFRVWGAN